MVQFAVHPKKEKRPDWTGLLNSNSATTSSVTLNNYCSVHVCVHLGLSPSAMLSANFCYCMKLLAILLILHSPLEVNKRCNPIGKVVEAKDH